MSEKCKQNSNFGTYYLLTKNVMKVQLRQFKITIMYVRSRTNSVQCCSRSIVPLPLLLSVWSFWNRRRAACSRAAAVASSSCRRRRRTELSWGEPAAISSWEQWRAALSSAACRIQAFSKKLWKSQKLPNSIASMLGYSPHSVRSWIAHYRYNIILQLTQKRRSQSNPMLCTYFVRIETKNLFFNGLPWPFSK